MTNDQSPLNNVPPNNPFMETEDHSENSGDSVVADPAPGAHLPLSQQVRFQSKDGRLLLFLPPEPPAQPDEDLPTGSRGWTELWQQLKHRIKSGDHNWQPGTEVHLIVGNRLLDVRQLQEIAEALQDAELQVRRVQATRRQTAVAAATVGYSVDQESEEAVLGTDSSEPSALQADPLYLQTTLRSGMEVRHPGTVVILGDVNPGGSVVADGDIIIWGRLRGTVHAGASGQIKGMIMALQMEPTLIRIADKLARGPEKPPAQFQPEIAYVTAKGIRISPASEYSKVKLWQID
ncbi:MAG: septum site-determining protein MinC [Microcoleaceae cyanobacterium]